MTLPRIRATMRGMMASIAMMALIFTVVLYRRTPESLAVEQGLLTLQKYEPGFHPNDFRVDGVDRIGAYWRVRFSRIRGLGKPATETLVHEQVIQAKRRRFWEPRPRPLPFLDIEPTGRKSIVTLRLD